MKLKEFLEKYGLKNCSAEYSKIPGLKALHLVLGVENKQEREELIRELVDGGADPNATYDPPEYDEDYEGIVGGTPLHFIFDATKEPDWDAAKLLVSLGARLDLTIDPSLTKDHKAINSSTTLLTPIALWGTILEYQRKNLFEMLSDEGIDKEAAKVLRFFSFSEYLQQIRQMKEDLSERIANSVQKSAELRELAQSVKEFRVTPR